MSEHDWIRTVPTDGRWCELCGLAEARWAGEACPGEGAAREVERRMMERLTQRDAAVLALADEWDAVTVVDEWDAADRWADAPDQLRALVKRI